MAAFRPDLAMLEVRLPDGDIGSELAVRLRGLAEIPIVFVTAADAIDERVRVFEVGADDYLVKPFATSELLARIRADGGRSLVPGGTGDQKAVSSLWSRSAV